MKVSVGVDNSGFAVVHVEGKDPREVVEAYLEARRILSMPTKEDVAKLKSIAKSNNKEEKDD